MKMVLIFILALVSYATPSKAWFDETHVAIAKATGYSKWFNAVGPDMIKEKMGNREEHNHFVNNPRGAVITPEMVLVQAEKYDQIDSHGHLYGAIIASVRDYLKKKKSGEYGEYHLGFCAHYVGDLSQPLHNTEHNLFNLTYHKDFDGIINEEVLENLEKIKVYPMRIDSEEALAKEIARIANQAMILEYKLEDERRVLTKDEAYQQISHSASLFRAILECVNGGRQDK
jgi:hypothetical protein